MVGERLFHIYFLLLMALHYKAFLQSTLHFWRVGALEISHFYYYQRFTVQNMNEFQERDSILTDVREHLICIVSLPLLSFILKSFHTVADFHSNQTSSASNEKHSSQQECHEHTVFNTQKSKSSIIRSKQKGSNKHLLWHVHTSIIIKQSSCKHTHTHTHSCTHIHTHTQSTVDNMGDFFF